MTTRGKYPDRDYSLKGLGMRVDTLEEAHAKNAELLESVAALIRQIKFWAPVLASGAAGSMITNRDFISTLGKIVNGIAGTL